MADNCIRRLYLASVFLLLGIIISSFNFQVIAAENLSKQKLSSLILQNEIVKEVNENPNAGWKASFNARFANATVAEFKRLLGVKPTPKTAFLGVPIVSHDKSLTLPKEFDARKTWSQCPSIARILDQGHCGACWAFGAVESLSDRFCIKYNINVSLSVNDLLACCGLLCGLGCNGGFPMGAWLYFKYHGVVTEECDPYFDKTGCSHPGCEPAYPTPKCERKCVGGNQLWNESKHYGVGAYKISSEPQDIMAEVYINGPVEVAFTVYEDFAHYKSGVYKHITGTNIGGHAVKLIGWGTSDDGEDYWLLANQWNRSWGDDGYFKIKRGTNECGIEHGVVAGLPSDRNVFKGVTTSDDLLVSSF